MSLEPTVARGARRPPLHAEAEACVYLFVPLNVWQAQCVSGDTRTATYHAQSASLPAAVTLARALLSIAILLSLSFAASARAQVGSTTDILTGVITGPDGKPLAGATVDATALDGQITRHATTGNNGRYTILFPDGGGQYRVTVRFLGMAPITFVDTRQSDEDRLVRDVALSPTSARLQEVTVVARRRTPRERVTPGHHGARDLGRSGRATSGGRERSRRAGGARAWRRADRRDRLHEHCVLGCRAAADREQHHA